MNHALLPDIVLGLAALGYVAATIAFAIHLARQGGWEKALRVARWILAGSVSLHALALGLDGIAQPVCPMKTIHFGVSMGGLVAAFVYLIARRVLRIYGLGVFVAPVAVVFLLAGRFMAEPAVVPALHTGMLPVHIAANILGDSFFVLAAGSATMYLVQERQLKTKRGASVFGRLPPIDSLDRASHIFVIVGFLLASFGAATGTIWIAKLSLSTTTEIVRLLISYASWAVFSAVLLLRATLGWRGRRAAYGTLVGFVFAMIVLTLYLFREGS